MTWGGGWHFRHDRRDLIRGSLRRCRVFEQQGTPREFWAAAPGTSSHRHNWSAGPVYDRMTYLLGVGPAAPGHVRVPARRGMPVELVAFGEVR